MPSRSSAAPSSGKGCRVDRPVARDTNFYYSFLVLPERRRKAIIAVWDFCRAVDDAVDEAPREQVAGAVALWRSEVAACFEGREPATEQGRMLVPVLRE